MATKNNPDQLMDEFEARQTVNNYALLLGFNADAITLPAGYTLSMFAMDLMTHVGRMAKAQELQTKLSNDPDHKTYEGLPAAQAFIDLMRTANGVRS